MASKSIDTPATLAQKAYQVVISRLDGLKLEEDSYREKQFELVDKGIGGFIIFGGRREELKSFISKLQDRSRIPLFIASDIERGVGQQVEGMTNFPSQMAFAAGLDRSVRRDKDLLFQAIRAVVEEALEIGINMPLIPVLDVNTNPDNPIICTRAFSDDPGTVSELGSVYIRILEESGLTGCAKHFPGHGDTATDSHISLPEIRKTKEALFSSDIAPFKAAIEAGVGSIMIGHLSIPSLDERPASLSGRIIQDLLKDDLSFKGLVLTDALNMHALRSYGDAGLECLKAGADILLHPDNPDETVLTLLAAIEEKRLDTEILDKAVWRIIEHKKHIMRQSPPSIDFGSHDALSRKISLKAVTLVKSAPGLLPFTKDKPVRVVLAGDEKYFSTTAFSGFGKSSTVAENQNYSGNGTLLVAVFTSVAAWRGTSGISGNERDMLANLIARADKSVVISFGSPYVLRYFDNADALIAAYDPTLQAQESVISCLRGESRFTGKLPVKLSGVTS